MAALHFPTRLRTLTFIFYDRIVIVMAGSLKWKIGIFYIIIVFMFTEHDRGA